MRRSYLYLFLLLASCVLPLTAQRKTRTQPHDTIDYKNLGEVIVVAPTHRRIMQQQTLSAISLDVKPLIASMGSLNELVAQSSGVRLRESGGVGSSNELSINGLSGHAVRYFINGVPLSSMGEGASLATLPVNLIDRVEIYKGVVPPELGMDALGGAVNIVTNSRGESYLDCSLRGGSFHTFALDLAGQYREQRSGFTVRPTLRYQYSKNDYIMRGMEVWNGETQEYEQRDFRRFHDGYQSLLGRLQLGVTKKPWADAALLGVGYTKSASEIQTGFRQTLVIGEAMRDRDDLSFSAHYAKRNLFTPGLSATIDASFARNRIIITDTAYRKYSWDGTFVETHYSELMRRTRMIRHTVRPSWTARANLAYSIPQGGHLNFNYQMSSIANERYDTYDPNFESSRDRMAQHIFGLSYGTTLLHGRLRGMIFAKDYLYHVAIEQADMYWLTGVKDVPTQQTKNNLGYGLGLRYTVADELAVKASFERATRLPTARELMGNGANIYPNFKLQPEQAYNLNLTLYGQAQWGGLHFLNYEATAFYRNVSNYIHRVVLGDVESQYDNVGSSLVLGGEMEVKYNYANLLDLTLNGTYTDERDRTRINIYGQPNPTYGYRIPNDPFLYGNLLLGANWRKPFGIQASAIHFNAGLGYIHWFYLTWAAFGRKNTKAVIPTSYDLSAGVTWSFAHDRYSISLQSSNLLDRPLYDNYMLQKPGRAFYCKLRIFLN